MAEKEFFSFEEALHELRLKEEELKRLVSEGEIRAFREGETMKLRRSDVESLRTELSGGEIVDLGEAKEELVFEDEAVLEEAGMATQEISDVETLLDEPVEDVGEIEIEEAVEAALPEEPQAEEEEPAPRAAVEVEGPCEPMGVRIAILATFALFVLAIPVCLSASGRAPSGVARAIAGLFPFDLP